MADRISNEVLITKLDNLINSFEEFKNNYNEHARVHAQEHQRIDKIIYGNGNVKGMKDEVLLNTQFRKNANRLLWLIAGAFITELIAIGFFATKFIHF